MIESLATLIAHDNAEQLRAGYILSKGGSIPTGGQGPDFPVKTLDDFMDFVRGGGSGIDGIEAVTPSTAMKFAAVWACINARSMAIAQIPLLTYRVDPLTGDKERARDHYLWPLLRKRWNPYMTAYRGKRLMQAWCDLHGNAYAWLQINGRGQVQGIWPWQPTRVSVDFGDANIGPVYEYRNDDNTKIRQPWFNMIHLRGIETDGFFGISPISAHAEAIGYGKAIQRHGTNFFAHGTVSRVVLSAPAGVGLTKDQVSQLREMWADSYGGVSNMHKAIVMAYGVKPEPLTLPLKDQAFMEQMQGNIEDIARVYDTPPHRIGHLLRCLPGDAEVYTEEGPRAIREVGVGDVVWSYSKTSGGLVKSVVKHVWLNGYDNITTLRTTNRTLRCNAKHKVLARVRVLEPRMATIGGYRGDDGQLYSVLGWENAWVEAGSLSVGDTLVAANGIPESGTNVLASGRTATVGFMEFCGLLLADGNVTKTDGDAIGVQIARSSSAAYMDHYRAVILEEFHKYRASTRVRSDDPITLNEAERQTRFRSKSAAQELDFLGMSGTALTKRVPGWVYMLTPELRLAFLRGFLDGDGTVDKKGRIVYRTINRDMISGLRHLCIGLGIPVTNIQRVNNKRTAYIKGRAVTGKHDLYSFTCSDPGSNKRIGSHDPRYVERFDSAKPFGRKGRKYPDYGGSGFIEGELQLSRIATISTGTVLEPVYDLEVEDTHSYIADGVVVSNSTNNNIEFQGHEWYQDRLGPVFTNWEEELTNSLLSDREAESIQIEFLLDYLMRTDAASRANYYSKALGGAPWMQQNEVRRKENLNRDKDPESDRLPVTNNAPGRGTEKPPAQE